MIEYVKKVGVGKEKARDLTYQEAYDANKQILYGKSTDIQTGAFWSAMRIKYSTIEELKGFADSLREETRYIDSGDFNPVDISVGYDGKNRSFHILPASIFIATGAGAKVVGHGSEKVPSKLGITYNDVLKAMGCGVASSSEEILKSLELSGFGYYHQKHLNPKLYSLLGKRREFGIRSYLNTVEKLLNPFKTTKVLIGMAHSKFKDRYVQLAHHVGFKDIYIISGLEGTVEPYPNKDTKVCTNKIFSISILPKDMEDEKIFTRPINLKENAELCLSILKNEDTSLKKWAIITAGLIIYTYGIGKDIKESTEIAEESLKIGSAYECFEIYKSLSLASTKKPIF